MQPGRDDAVRSAPPARDPGVAPRAEPGRVTRRAAVAWFLTLGAGAVLLALLLLVRDRGEVIRVTIPDAFGLSTGSDVVFRGVRIGEIESIDVETDAVYATILVTEKDVEIDENDGVRIVNSLLGRSQLEILPRDAPVLDVDREIIPVPPVRDTGT